MYLFRIHIRPQGGTADMAATFDYCLRHGILGVGWRIDISNTNIWETYLSVAEPQYGKLQICSYIKRWVSEGDLVWTRDTSGNYFLARAKSGWEYWTCAETWEKDFDIANVFRCDILPIPIDAVPGKVVACFRASRTIQEVNCASAREYSKHLWNKGVKAKVYEVAFDQCRNIFMLLDDQETEDVIFLYLQSQGWYVMPNSRKKDTMSFEYLVVHPHTGELRAVQVKTGGTTLDQNHFSASPLKVFLFQASDLYSGAPNSNVITIRPGDIETFLSQSTKWLPKAIRDKLAIVDECRSRTEASR